MGQGILRGLALAVALVGLWACKPGGAAHAPGSVDAARLAGANADGDNWMSYGRTYAEQRFSPLTDVSTGNVNKLGLAWHYQFDTDRGQEATPLVVDGTLYTTTTWSKVYAFDAATGALKWSFDPKVPGEDGFKACCDVVNRGVAVWKGKVYVGTIAGQLIALDAATGVPVWTVQATDPSKPYTITGAPRIAKGMVLIGEGGAEYGVRGYLSAYDAETGKMLWRFYTTPNPQGKPDGAASDDILASKAATTWGGKVPPSGGGGTVWDSIVYDPDLNRIYFGTGNGTPWVPVHRSDGKSDNLFLSSIVAVDADTGKYVWHYQNTPDDAWDYDSDQPMILADLNVGGAPRKVVMQANKNGFFYVIDRNNGQLISATPYIPPGSITWAKSVDVKTGRPVENPGARYGANMTIVSPAPYGAHNWQPISYNPTEGLVYIPAMISAYAYGVDPKFKYQEGAWNLGLNYDFGGLPDDKAQFAAMKASLKGMLVAWDPVAGKARWTVNLPVFWNAGTLATAGDLVFQGNGDGKFVAYGAKDGKPLWSYDAGVGITAAPMTYRVGGAQYVAIMVGYGGAAPLAAHFALPNRPRLAGRLLVFKIGGTDTAPAYPPVQKTAITLSGINSTGDEKAGFTLFEANCSTCHGPSVSGAYLPDLKTSPMILTSSDFASVVLGGARKSRGMASFARFLDAGQVESIRAYILKQARAAQATG
ncbi:MAG TPA: PQQ-dependent dehydrogenase, methanol/ethanol family [Caulobacteraceae bacterium]|jgi:PQQ-dependent dehydrogenase (methanol/ethanol family)|nr:PQQ-dependent dehydrogenase, methanol/ethanol family [Caulobacteraceae bacterium]